MKKVYKPKPKLGGGMLCTKCNKIIRYFKSEDEAQGICGPVLCDSCLYELVYKYKTKHRQGFTFLEIKDLLVRFPTINEDKFFDALRGNTCMIVEKDMITYHCDIVTALSCGLENRNITLNEWD